MPRRRSPWTFASSGAALSHGGSGVEASCSREAGRMIRAAAFTTRYLPDMTSSGFLPISPTCSSMPRCNSAPAYAPATLHPPMTLAASARRAPQQRIADRGAAQLRRKTQITTSAHGSRGLRWPNERPLPCSLSWSCRRFPRHGSSGTRAGAAVRGRARPEPYMARRSPACGARCPMDRGRSSPSRNGSTIGRSRAV